MHIKAFINFPLILWNKVIKKVPQPTQIIHLKLWYLLQQEFAIILILIRLRISKEQSIILECRKTNIIPNSKYSLKYIQMRKDKK